jgi:hypothetical protein
MKCVTPTAWKRSSSWITSVLLPATKCFYGLRTTSSGVSETLAVLI